MSLRHDLDSAVGYLDGGLIVNCVRPMSDAGCPSFCASHGIFRQVRVIEVRKDFKIDRPQHAVAICGRLPAIKVLPDEPVWSGRN